MSDNSSFYKNYSDDWEEASPIAPTSVDELVESAPAVRGPSSALSACPVGTLGGAAIGRHAAQALSAGEPPPRVALSPFAREAGVPALMARSPIFRAGRGGEAVAKLQEIDCYPPYEASVEGARLSMGDKPIWELAIAAARKHGFAGEEFPVSLSEMAKDTGGNGNGANLRAVAERLQRLAAARVSYALPGGARGDGRMLGSARRDGLEWVVSLDPGLVPALSLDKIFQVNAKRRGLLKGELAMWLHDFVATHKAFEAGFKLGDLCKLCGYCGDRSKFSTFLRDAMDDLVARAPEVVASYEIERLKRSSFSWRLLVERGAEKPSFRMPKEAHAARAAQARAAAPSDAAVPVAARTRKHRGGVWL